MKQRNYVAKHSYKYNNTKIFEDRKKASKRGYVKYKGKDNTLMAY